MLVPGHLAQIIRHELCNFLYPSQGTLHTLPTARCVIDGVGTRPCMTNAAGFGQHEGMSENSTHTHTHTDRSQLITA
ncbi:hypothetical protein CGRA01v4_08447 [Colletotrichum graminicola]|nr:hypothetical protein CGRA01v4_08447 [Colletotrichum graminicola]